MPDFMSLKKVWGKLESNSQQGGGVYGQGISNGTGAPQVTVIVPQEDRAGRINLILRALQVFFAFVTLLIGIYLAVFQAKWVGSPSGLTGLILFLATASLLASIIFLVIPIVHEHSDYKMMKGAARALSEARVGMVCNAIFTFLLFILAITQTVSAYTSAGCKDPTKDPHAGGKDKGDFINALGGFCRTKRAEAAFCWFLWITWLVSLLFFLRQWKLERKNGPRIPPFIHPAESSAFGPIEDSDDDDGFDEAAAKSGHYGDGGRGHYGAGGASRPSSYDRGGSNPLADIEARYGVTPTYTSDPFADRLPTAGYGRPSYEVAGGYGTAAPGSYAVDPYSTVQYQLGTSRIGAPPPPPNLNYGYY